MIYWAKRLVSVIVLLLLGIAFFVPQQSLITKLSIYFLKIQPAISWSFLIVLLLTPLWGRFFCECLCPLGILQSIVNRIRHPKTAVRRVCTCLPQTRAQQIVRWSIFSAIIFLSLFGLGALSMFIMPYSIVGSALSFFVPGIILLGIILFVALFGQGRLWCNWVCPAGTVFEFASKRTLWGNKVGKSCAACRKCFNDSSSSCVKPKSGVTRLEVVQGVVILASSQILDKTVENTLVSTSLFGDSENSPLHLPPGAIEQHEFLTKCIACGLCIKHCPTQVLRQSVNLQKLGSPEMFFENGYCRLACRYRCASACPTGALIPRTKERTKWHFGRAVWHSQACVRNTNGDICIACIRNCPVKAIKAIDGKIVINESLCVGCGACEHVCPARSNHAIVVNPLAPQFESAIRK